MNLHIVKQYFEPKSILDIGGHVGEFYHLCRSNFNFDKYFLIEGFHICEPEFLKEEDLQQFKEKCSALPKKDIDAANDSVPV